MAVSESQIKANKKWAENNKERRAYLSKRSNARSFLRKHATEEDLLELKEIIEKKLEKINEKC